MRIRCAIALVCLFVMFSSVASAKSFYLDLNICKDDSVTLNGFAISDVGSRSLIKAYANNDYEFKVYSSSQSLLFDDNFYLSFTAAPFIGPNGTLPEYESNCSEDLYNLPFFEDANTIELLHNGHQIFTYNITGKSSETDITALLLCVLIIVIVVVCVSIVIIVYYRGIR